MVQIAVKLFRARKRFIDSLRIYVRGGTGGQGLSKYNGIGGRGGDVYVIGQEEASFKKLCQSYPDKRLGASKGDDSSGRALQGAPGPALEVPVPSGISIKTDVGTVLGEINEVGEKVLVARGGDGGMVSNQYVGQKGHALSVTLDLKLISDVGFVGFPNAGKSTLLKALSRAAPKIASYPFTTIQPQLGIMEYEDKRQISVADLPGLVEGAHINVGMGHKFLKHVERTKILAFVVDVLGFRLSAKHELRSAFENILLLNKELELYKQELVNKPAILILNKIDIEGADQQCDVIMKQLDNITQNLSMVNDEFRPQQLVQFDDVMRISAKHRWNVDELKQKLRQLLDTNADLEMNSNILERRWTALRRQTSEHFGQHLV